MVPPCASTNSFTTARPIPEPPYARDLDFSTRYNFSNINSISFDGIPIPVSITEITVLPSFSYAFKQTSEFSLEYFKALSNKFSIICSNLRASA